MERKKKSLPVFRFRTLFVLLLAFAFILAACSEDSVIDEPDIDTVAEVEDDPAAAESFSSASGTAPLTITNNLEVPLCYVFYSPITSAAWGDDILGAETIIQPGTEYIAEGMATGEHDLLLVTCEDDRFYQRVNLAADGTASIVTGPGGREYIGYSFNNTGETDLCELYFSETTDSSWGPERLAGEVLTVGNSFYVFGLLEGQYDVRVVDCQGAENVYNDVAINNDN